jgi:hypothetical protein
MWSFNFFCYLLSNLEVHVKSAMNLTKQSTSDSGKVTHAGERIGQSALKSNSTKYLFSFKKMEFPQLIPDAGFSCFLQARPTMVQC